MFPSRFCFAAIWIEKGMDLIIPGCIPSALHEVVEYFPSLTEWKKTVGIWAFVMLVLTIVLKIAIAVFNNELKLNDNTIQQEAA